MKYISFHYSISFSIEKSNIQIHYHRAIFKMYELHARQVHAKESTNTLVKRNRQLEKLNYLQQKMI